MVHSGACREGARAAEGGGLGPLGPMLDLPLKAGIVSIGSASAYFQEHCVRLCCVSIASTFTFCFQNADDKVCGVASSMYVPALVAVCVFLWTVSPSRAEMLHNQSSMEVERITCPPWFIVNSSGHCTCGSLLGGLVECQLDPHCSTPYYYISLPAYYCITSEVKLNATVTVLGGCPYSSVSLRVWSPDLEKPNSNMCTERWARTGQLCAKCQKGYGPPVYSYSFYCVPCSTMNSVEVVKFVAASFLPLTVFCVAVVLFRVSATKPPLGTFILVSQILAAPQHMQVVQSYAQTQTGIFGFTHPQLPDKLHTLCWKLFATLFGVWNLDFFRSVYPPMCLSPNMTNLQVAFLDYSIGLYPLFMVVLIYLTVRLHDHGCGAVLWTCAPLHRCCAPLLRRLDIRSSLIDAFSTFLVLAYVKIGYTSVFILEPTRVYTPDGAYKVYVFADASIEYMGNEHLWYALPALIITLVFNILPLLFLFLFPLRCFQRCLHRCGLQCLVLRTFADAFQGCYKDGTDGTRDCRWFSGVHLLVRFGIVVAFEMARHHATYIILAVVVVFLHTTIVGVMQPYKTSVYFKIDMMLLLGLSCWINGILILEIERDTVDTKFGLHLTTLIASSLIPLVYVSGLFLYWLCVVKQCRRRVAVLVLWCCRRQEREHEQLLQDSA